MVLLLRGTTAWATAAEPSTNDFELWLDEVDRLIPQRAEEYPKGQFDALRAAAEAVERWAAVLAGYHSDDTAEAALVRVHRLLDGKQRVDHLLEIVLDQRGQLVALSQRDNFRDALREYLRTTSLLIDLSGRMRFAQFDAVDMAGGMAIQASQRQQLLDLLTEYRSSIGAAALSPALFTPHDASDLAWRIALVRLMGDSGETVLRDGLAELLRQDNLPGPLVLEAAASIRKLGLPQPPRPADSAAPAAGASDELPPLTPASYLAALRGISASGLSASDVQRRNELIAWAEVRASEGIVEGSYTLGGFELRPGDWLLMRNPSPYNLFTDLAPGLFTHVGVVAMEEGSDGIRRMVLVDLPERGRSIPATNVEQYVNRTLHYVFLRHPDPQVAEAMGEAAASIIGNPSQFDLNFRTDRVLPLRGVPLAGEKIHTYCAGLLLLCALQTSAERAEFFPVSELCAGGYTAENLATLGLSVGDDFVSPTGALFSPVLEIVGQREPMYEPRREVQEAVFDHFAVCLEEKVLVPAPDLRQSLTQKLAEAAQTSPALAEALAAAANVSAGMDLVSAAKAAAVVETLDEIAFGRSDEFLDAWDSLRAGTVEALQAEGATPDDLAMVSHYRRRHAELYQQWTARRLSPRQLRIALVEYYAHAGRDDLQQRFFVDPDAGGRQ